MIKNAPVVEKTGAQTFYNGNRSRGLFGFFGSGSGLAGLAGGKSDALGNVFGNGYYVHKINGRRVSWYHKARYETVRYGQLSSPDVRRASVGQPIQH